MLYSFSGFSQGQIGSAMSKCKLNEKAVKSASCPPSSTSIDFYDGNGLSLRVSRYGRKNWRYRYEINGAKKTLILGTYPDLNLKQVRKQRDKAFLLRKAGLDPSKPQAGAATPSQKPIPEPVPVAHSNTESQIAFKDLVARHRCRP